MYDSILGQMSLEAHAIYLYHSNNQSKYCNNNNTAIILSILFETHFEVNNRPCHCMHVLIQTQ